MEMLVMAVVVVAAFAAVLLPLFRRRPGIGDEREFENIAGAETQRAILSDSPASVPSALPAAPASEPPSTPDAQHTGASESLEGRVLRYRAAVRAGTVCRKCGQANPAGSIYCYECGTRLPRADAKEFE